MEELIRRMRAESGDYFSIPQKISEDSDTEDDWEFCRNITIESQKSDGSNSSRFSSESSKGYEENDDEKKSKEFGKIRYIKKKDACSSYYMRRMNAVETSTLEFDSIASFYNLYELSD